MSNQQAQPQNIDINKEMLKESVGESGEQHQEQWRELNVSASTKSGIEKVAQTSDVVTEAIQAQREQLELTAEQLEQQAAEVRAQAELVRQAEDIKAQVKLQEAERKAELAKEKARIEAERLAEDLARGLTAAKEKVKGLAHSVVDVAGAGIHKVGHMGTYIKESIVGTPDLTKDLKTSADNLESAAQEMRAEAAKLKESEEKAGLIKITETEVKMDLPSGQLSATESSTTESSQSQQMDIPQSPQRESETTYDYQPEFTKLPEPSSDEQQLQLPTDRGTLTETPISEQFQQQKDAFNVPLPIPSSSESELNAPRADFDLKEESDFPLLDKGETTQVPSFDDSKQNVWKLT